MQSMLMTQIICSPSSGNSSQTSAAVSATRTPVRVYRHEPYAASLITPASPADSAIVSCHTRPARSSPARSVSEAALPSGDISDCSSTTAPLPAVATPQPPAVMAAQTPVWVAFKYGRKPFVAAFSVQSGQRVVVEGDRGVDLGIVGDVCLMQGGPRPQSILRAATLADEARHLERMVKEEEALRTMRCLAVQVDCPAHVEDAMFQLDGKKITVIISRHTRSFVDFRRLQRALFDVYRCRIWFAYLDEIQETMSTDVTQPLHRGQRRRPSPAESGMKKPHRAMVPPAVM